LLPERELDAADSLKWLLEGLNAIGAESRKPIRPLNF
jgi:hypothetical protein